MADNGANSALVKHMDNHNTLNLYRGMEMLPQYTTILPTIDQLMPSLKESPEIKEIKRIAVPVIALPACFLA